MILVRLRHEGGGIYRYGEPGRPVGRLRLDTETGCLERLEYLGRDPYVDPYITAAGAIRWHWRKYHELPDVLEVEKPPYRPVTEPGERHPAPVRQGRLRQVSGRAMPVAEIAKRQHQ